MLSIICEADFKEVKDPFRKSRSYANLKTNNHIDSVYSNEFFKQFIQTISSNPDNLQESAEKILLDQIDQDKVILV